MADIIQLLPDVVANQIAAGEVIQRPASALKELMENAVDAGGRKIKVVIREAGKALIQVIDDGCGMSETDARMSFERYATSKLRKAEDLFAIRTMGFRGEALASIAAIAHVELRTRRPEDETGMQLVVEGADLISSEPIACNSGTSIAVKNLFYNVPARRNFLKSNAAEMRHLIEEFQRVALANPGVEFTMHHNETEVFHLKPGNFRQRIAGVFGSSYNEKLVPVEEETTLVNIRGFVGKPEFAKKSRGEQYFFVNNRYIRDPYLHHAVANAFDELLPPGSFPSYFLLLETDPSKIDINVHPTKTEIKFEDDKSVYAILRASVKRALRKFSVAPVLDFEQETSFNIPLSALNQVPVPPRIHVDPSFNPFKTGTEIRFPGTVHSQGQQIKQGERNWSLLYAGLENAGAGQPSPEQPSLELNTAADEDWISKAPCFQFAMKYIIVPYLDRLLVVDQQAAHEKILFEKNLEAMNSQPVSGQQLVFPCTIEMNPGEFSVIMEMKQELKSIGFDINEFGKNTWVVHGVPPGVHPEEIKETLETLAEQFGIHAAGMKLLKTERIARIAASRMAVKSGTPLQLSEMKKMLADLFNSAVPGNSPSGKTVFYAMTSADFDKKFSG